MQSQRALRLLSRGAAPARRRAAARRPHGACLRRAAGAGRPLARYRRRAQGRALSPRADRHLCAARRDGMVARQARSAASAGRAGAGLRDGGRAQGRSRHDPRLAGRQQARRPGARPAAGAAARGRRVRLPSRLARHPPELRRARARHGRAGRGGRRGQRLCGAGRGGARGAADRPSSAIRAPLASPHTAYGEETAGELAMLRVAADAHRRYGAGALPQLRDLQGRQRLGHPRSGGAAEGGRAAAAARGPARRRHRAAVRDHRRPAALRRRSWTRCSPAGLSPAARLARRHPGGDAGLFRQQQGRRLPHLDLGALQGRAGADRRLPPASGRAAPVPRPRRLGRPRRRPELRGDPGAAARRACRARSASPSRAR